MVVNKNDNQQPCRDAAILGDKGKSKLVAEHVWCTGQKPASWHLYYEIPCCYQFILDIDPPERLE